jgi:hypothetical protein
MKELNISTAKEGDLVPFNCDDCKESVKIEFTYTARTYREVPMFQPLHEGSDQDQRKDKWDHGWQVARLSRCRKKPNETRRQR